MKNEELIKVLKDDMFLNHGVYHGILKEIGNRENCFGDGMKDVSSEILHDKDAFKGFAILASTCAIFMAYSWESDARYSRSPHWDERKSASEEFCFRNQNTFLEIFEEYADFPFPFKREVTYDKGFVRETTLCPYSALYQEMNDFVNEHSTIKQKMMGMFCRVLSDGGVKTDLLSKAGFPFI